jgi:hypothetical protein
LPKNQASSVIYPDYSGGSTTFGEIAGVGDATYNRNTLVLGSPSGLQVGDSKGVVCLLV